MAKNTEFHIQPAFIDALVTIAPTYPPDLQHKALQILGSLIANYGRDETLSLTRVTDDEYLQIIIPADDAGWIIDCYEDDGFCLYGIV